MGVLRFISGVETNSIRGRERRVFFYRARSIVNPVYIRLKIEAGSGKRSYLIISSGPEIRTVTRWRLFEYFTGKNVNALGQFYYNNNGTI